MPASNFLRSKWYNLVLKATAYTPPATLYLEWCNDNTVPDAATAGTASGAGRQAATFAAGSNGVGSTSAQIVLSGVAAETYRYVELWDASTSGNRLAWAQVSDVVLSFSGLLYLDAAAMVGTVAGAATDYLRGKLYDHLFRNTTFTAPSNIYLELCSSATVSSNSSAGTASGAGRQAITFGADTNGVGNNSNAPAFSIGADTWRYIEFWDASTSGNRLLFQQITDIVSGAGSTVNVPAGNLTMQFT